MDDTQTPPASLAKETELHHAARLLDELDAHPEDSERIKAELAAIDPADLADEFEQLSAESRESLVAVMPEFLSGEVLAELESDIVEDVLPLLPTEAIAEAISELDSDDATQIVEELDLAQRAEVLDALDPEDRADLEEALSFDEDEIGRLMQREYVAAPLGWNVGRTIDHMRSQTEKGGEELPERFFNIYIVDEMFRPQGYVPISKLMRSARSVRLSDIVETPLRVIEERMDKEEAARIFETYHLISAPVVDEGGVIRGVMTADDIIDIIQDENAEDLLALAGVSETTASDTALETVRARAPWLLVNLGTAILASLVIALFDEAIAKLVALAVLMPIVASMGGNAGTQALTVAVRQLTEGDLTPKTAWRAIRREATAALIIGLIFAVAMAVIAYIWFREPGLALVIFIAMIVNHIFAGLAGILVPLGLKRMGADPAVASSVFVTTVTDVVGFFAFLGLAVLLLL